MLTIEKLKLMKPGPFAQGEVNNDDLPVPTINPIEYPGAKFKWVAIRGGYHDWAIYLDYDNKSYEEVKNNGQKTTSDANIIFLVPCNKDALNLYRK